MRGREGEREGERQELAGRGGQRDGDREKEREEREGGRQRQRERTTRQREREREPRDKTCGRSETGRIICEGSPPLASPKEGFVMCRANISSTPSPSPPPSPPPLPPSPPPPPLCSPLALSPPDPLSRPGPCAPTLPPGTSEGATEGVSAYASGERRRWPGRMRTIKGVTEATRMYALHTYTQPLSC